MHLDILVSVFLRTQLNLLVNSAQEQSERSNLIFPIALGCTNFFQLQNMEKLIWMMNSGDREIVIKICYFITKHENPE
jgi:hypothetical protein